MYGMIWFVACDKSYFKQPKQKEDCHHPGRHEKEKLTDPLGHPGPGRPWVSSPSHKPGWFLQVKFGVRRPLCCVMRRGQLYIGTGRYALTAGLASSTGWPDNPPRYYYYVRAADCWSKPAQSCDLPSKKLALQRLKDRTSPRNLNWRHVGRPGYAVRTSPHNSTPDNTWWGSGLITTRPLIVGCRRSRALWDECGYGAG